MKLEIHQFNQSQRNVRKRKGRYISAAKKDAPTKYRMEEFVRGMVLRKRLANMKDAPIRFSREEFVSDMVPNTRFAVKRDVPIRSRREEFV